jgi:hypothetical protein
MQKVCARKLGSELGEAEAIGRVAVRFLGFIAAGEQRPATRLHADCPVGLRRLRRFGQSLKCIDRSGGISSASGRLDELGKDVAALAIDLMTNTAVTGATFDIDGGQQLLDG